MSARTATPLTTNLLAATLDLIWRQWRAIGGAAAGGAVRKQVDLEVLCLASLTLEAHEPRLWDSMADWVRSGSTLVSVQRLKNLSAAFPHGAKRLPELVRVAVDEAKDARWSTLARGNARPRKRQPVKSRTAGPSFVTGPGLTLRMRAVFGIGVKADLISFLLGSEHRITVSGAGAALGYTTPAVFRSLQDLQTAGFLRTWDGPSATEYWIEFEPWVSLLGGREHIAPWGHWRERLGYVCSAVRWEEDAVDRSVSDYARGTAMRELSTAHRGALARALGKEVTVPESTSVAEWTAFHKLLAKQFELDG